MVRAATTRFFIATFVRSGVKPNKTTERRHRIKFSFLRSVIDVPHGFYHNAAWPLFLRVDCLPALDFEGPRR